METKLIDGKQIAREIRAELKEKIKALKEAGKPVPKLVVILVGEDPASEIYVRNKAKACGWIQMESETIPMRADIREEELLKKIQELNQDPGVNGILVRCRCPRDSMQKRYSMPSIRQRM